MKAHKEGKTFYVKVRDAQSLLYEGNVVSLSSYNDKGPFDILPEHSHFISLIKQKLTIREQNGKSTELNVDTGILRFSSGKADVFLGIGT